MTVMVRSAFAGLLVLSVSLAPANVAAAAPGGDQPPSVSQVRAGEWWLSKLGVTKAWSKTKGRGVTVGLIDSGVASAHPDLQDVVAGGEDFSGEGDSRGGALPGDVHGTAMAGYIAGRGHGAGNKLGLIGAAPEAKLLSASIGLSGGLSGAGSKPGDGGKALRWVVDHGATVVNMSFGGG